MARVFITGSTQGLVRASASALLEGGHEVVLHARNPSRAASIGDLAKRASGVVIGDLASARETHDVAEQVNASRSDGRGHPQGLVGRSSGGSGRFRVRDEVAVGIRDGDVADAVVVGLDRRVLDARDVQLLEQLVEAGHGEGDVSTTGGSGWAR